MQLTQDEMLRYSEQIKLDQIGIAQQEKLKMARVLCVGAGGLGSSALFYLAAAGIGEIDIIDDDVIALNNLHRQILYHTAHINEQKAKIATQQLSSLNPTIAIRARHVRLTAKNAQEIIKQYDIIVDCSDNFTTRYLINDVCFHLTIPFVFASVSQFEGHCSLFLGKRGPCFRCVFPMNATKDILQACVQSGVLGVVPGLLGILQANEVIKFLLSIGESLSGKLLSVNLLTMQFRAFYLTENPDCLLCAKDLD